MNHLTTQEYEIQLQLKWLSQVNIDQALKDESIRQEIVQLILAIDNFTQTLPSNPYWPQAQKLIDKINALDPENQESQLNPIQGLNPNPKAKAYIQNLGLFNQTRIELNTSINVLKQFNQATERHHISRANEVLGFIGLGIPIANLAISAYQGFVKWYIDKKNEQKTQELDYYLEQHRLQIIKTGFIGAFNLSNFILTLLESSSISLYFNLANLCLEFIFIHLNHLKTKTKLITRNLELLEGFRSIKKEKDEIIDTNFILKKLQETASDLDHLTRLHMIEFLLNEQQLKANDYFYYFQFTIFAFMMTNIVVLQASGILDYHAVVLIGILSSYVYNCIQPYLSNLFLAMTQTKSHEIKDSLGQPLVIKHGQLFHPQAIKNQYLSPDMLFGLITKSMVPLFLITLTPTLNPLLAIGLVCSIQLLINGIEYGLKHVPPPPAQKPEIENPEPSITPP